MFLLLGFPLWILVVELVFFIIWTVLVQVQLSQKLSQEILRNIADILR